MKISVLIPCHNEEKTIAACLDSCLKQSRPPDEIIVVNDGSTDRTANVLRRYRQKIKVVQLNPASGNKSHAQQAGLPHVTGDVFVTTDADSRLHPNFIKEIEGSFSNPLVAAVSGYVKSLPYNWLTACRAYEYCIGQNIHKSAQSVLDYLYVIPGTASAFKTTLFRRHITFDHNTLTEDLDFTYRLHKNNLKIVFNKQAVVYTQDPATLASYINQMRRWIGGGNQNLLKHLGPQLIADPRRTLELSLIFIDGLIFSFLLLILPLINLAYAGSLLVLYLAVVLLLSLYAAAKEQRFDLLIVPFVYPLILFINAYVFIEQFIKEIVIQKHNLVWFQPERVKL